MSSKLLRTLLSWITLLLLVGIASGASIELLDGSARLDVTSSGEISIEVFNNSNSDVYTLNSNFSYPYMPSNGWNQLGGGGGQSGWGYLITQVSPDEIEIVATAPDYRLTRQITVVEKRFSVSDTFVNLSGDNLGIVFEFHLTSGAISDIPWVGGEQDKTWSTDYLTPNSTYFFPAAYSGIGMVIEDDYLRTQQQMDYDSSGVIMRNQYFGLPIGGSYTFQWSLYPQLSQDYFDFINQVRRDWNVNYTVDGAFGFVKLSYLLNSPALVIRDWINYRGIKVLAVGTPWLLCPGATTRPFLDDYDLNAHIAQLAVARQVVHSVCPDVKVISQMQSLISGWSDSGSIEPKFPDSVDIASNGDIKWYEYETRGIAAWNEMVADNLVRFKYCIALGNSYHAYLSSVLDAVVEAGLDGTYLDTFDSIRKPGYLRWTYGSWDNVSVDMDMDTYTIDETITMFGPLTDSGKLELLSKFSSDGKVIYANSAPATQAIQQAHINHFAETGTSAARRMDLSTPVILGYSTGYGYRGDDWHSDQFFFEDVCDYINNGYLYAVYACDNITRESIVAQMFPFTPIDIRPGIITGEERIITTQSGTYGWEDMSGAYVLYYDSTGTQVSGSIVEIIEGGTRSWQLTVPANGAAVLIRILTCEDVSAAGYGIAGDFNEDCHIDLKDFVILAGDWLLCNIPGDPNCLENW